MTMRLAGEDVGAVRGLDGEGWLREVTAEDADPGVAVDQQGAGRLLELRQSATPVSYFGNDGNLTLPTHVDAGGSPAASGNFRGPNNGRLTFRNSGNSADISAIGVDGDNKVHVSPGGADIVAEGDLDVLDPIKNTGAAHGGDVAFSDKIRTLGQDLNIYDSGETAVQLGLNEGYQALYIRERATQIADGDVQEDAAWLYVYNDGAGTEQLVVKLKVGGTVKTGTLTLA